jgi:microcystin degradation protein MlrC
MMRIALGGIWHETNTFVPTSTTFEDFERYQFASGTELVERYADTGTELGGAIREVASLGIDLVPTLYAAAVPSGTVTARAYDEVLGHLINEIDQARPVDGIVLALHGAMVAEGHPDAELDIVRAVREVVDDVPIGVILDLHANPSEELARTATVLVGYDTFPHVDMAERGGEAMRCVFRILQGESPPKIGFVKLPLLTVPQAQDTRELPMRSVMAALQKLEGTDPQVWTGTVSAGYPYSDVERLGVSVYVAAREQAEALARSLAAHIWEVRHDFIPELLEPQDAVNQALEQSGRPIVLVDVADNVGGGSPGDGTVLLAALERADAEGVVVIWDPSAVEEIYATDADNMVMEVGGRASALLGAPVRIEGTVRRLGIVTYRRSGPYMTGQEVFMGRVAILTSIRGAVVVMTEARVMPFDDDHLRAVGINPAENRILIAKSATAWKAAFGAYAAGALHVRTPGFCPSDLSQLPFTARPKPAFPLEVDTRWNY